MSEQEPKRVIAWDLDETLGNFRPIGYEMMGKEMPSFIEPTSIRYGISDLLSELSEAGYRHYVTTSGTGEYAWGALTQTGLIKNFTEVFGREAVSNPYGGKLYRPVIESENMTDDEARSNMIVVGDAPGDIPADVEGLVFVRQDAGHKYDALVVREILVTLLEAGKGSFKTGFEKLYASTTPKYPENPPRFQQRLIDLGNGISFEMTYEGGTMLVDENETVPVIEQIYAPDYKRE